MYNVNMNDFGKTIVERRKQMGLTQDALARQLGVSPQAVSKWETGAGMPDVALLPPLAAALGVSIDALFGDESRKDGAKNEIPGSFEGLSLIASDGDRACYSDKTAEKTENGVAFFSDGSTADLRSDTVKNCGKGEIRIIEIERIPEPGETELLSEVAEPDAFESVDIKTVCGRLELEKGEKPALHVVGKKGFLERLKWSVEDGVFQLKFDVEGDDHNWLSDKSRIKLVCPFGKGKTLKLRVNATSSCRIDPDFSVSDVRLSGSGDAVLANGDTATVRIDGPGEVNAGAYGVSFSGDVVGAGDLRVRKAERADIRLVGPGDVKLIDVVDELKAKITGSGDLIVQKVKRADVRMTGSGDVKLVDVVGELSGKITGAGQMTAAGDVETLKLKITGIGRFNGKSLKCDRAEIQLTGEICEAIIGQVRRESVEKLTQNATLKVKERGE